MITDARIFICVALVTIVANRKHVLHNRFIVYALKWHRFYICCVFSFSFFRSCFLFVYTIFAYRLPLVMLCLNNNSNASSRKTNKQKKNPKKHHTFFQFPSVVYPAAVVQAPVAWVLASFLRVVREADSPRNESALL